MIYLQVFKLLFVLQACSVQDALAAVLQTRGSTSRRKRHPHVGKAPRPRSRGKSYHKRVVKKVLMTACQLEVSNCQIAKQLFAPCGVDVNFSRASVRRLEYAETIKSECMNHHVNTLMIGGVIENRPDSVTRLIHSRLIPKSRSWEKRNLRI